MRAQYQVDILKNGWVMTYLIYLRYTLYIPMTCQNRYFSHHFGTLPWYSEFYISTDFDASESVIGSFFSRSLRKSDLKTSIAALYPDLFALTFFTWWPEITLTCTYYSHKARDMILTNVRDTYITPIHEFCLRLTSKLCSLMSPSPKSQTFRLWPDLWRHQWPLGQISHRVWKVYVQGYQMTF